MCSIRQSWRACGRLMLMSVCAAALLQRHGATGFISPHTSTQGRPNSFSREVVRHRTRSPLYMAKFDVSKPSFDLLSLRSIRGDALVRYNALNQSEPLRIALYALLCFVLGTAPTLSDTTGYDSMSLPAQIVSYSMAAGSAGLFLRECSKRSKQLTRMEKELNTESLPIRLPTNALADQKWTKPARLSDLRGLSTPPRIIAISGTPAKVEEALTGLSVFGRRLKQASVYVVPITTDGSKVECANGEAYRPWVADPYDVAVWKEYFADLTNNGTEGGASAFRWFGLNSSGRSFGSGEDEIPLWLQVLGQHLRPTQLLDSSDAEVSADDDARVVLDLLNTFYKALTSGDESQIDSVFAADSSQDVSEVIQAGGRIDSWNDCLAEGARPEGMLVSGADVTFISPTEAYSTAIEFPTNTGVDSATLLAVQTWRRETPEAKWKLQLHQTIPWSPEAKAQGTLRCDCRGCVALTRGNERRTFGGIIG